MVAGGPVALHENLRSVSGLICTTDWTFRLDGGLDQLAAHYGSLQLLRSARAAASRPLFCWPGRAPERVLG